ETDLFPKSKKVLDAKEMAALGASLEEERIRIEKKGMPRKAIPAQTKHAAALD
ncbi:MAG: hypothetical protein QOI66_5152, partial [Myxococcales bacterium]|nr:hypothetical protein [Myxococcales bacterium]